VLIYLFGAGIDGRSEVGPFAARIDQSFTDILENLDVGTMGSYRATNGQWTHTIDAMYTALSAEQTRASGIRIKADIDQLIASYDLGYRLAERLEVLAGLRYNSIEADLVATAPASISRARGNKGWVDPYVGLSSTIPFNDTFALTLRADIGGFDVGSTFAWQAVVRFDWNFTKSFFGSFGYRILDTNYEDGSGENFFKYDLTTSGPGLGFGWKFQ
jgi:hypothetical protein